LDASGRKGVDVIQYVISTTIKIRGVNPHDAGASYQTKSKQEKTIPVGKEVTPAMCTNPPCVTVGNLKRKSRCCVKDEQHWRVV